MTNKNIFKLFAVVGIVVSAVDLNGIETSSPICVSNGCTIVNQITHFGSIPFTIAGIMLFSFLLIVSFYKNLSLLLDITIALSLITEGLLVGFQAFYLQSFCTICVGIFIIIVVMFVLRLFGKNGNRTIFVMGAVGFAALFILSFILYTPIWQPKTGTTLIYSDNCPHCENVLRKIKKDKLLIKKIHIINLKRAKAFLFNIGIKSIPVLVIKGKNIKIIKGENDIDEELSGNIADASMLNILNAKNLDSCDFTTDKSCNSIK